MVYIRKQIRYLFGKYTSVFTLQTNLVYLGQTSRRAKALCLNKKGGRSGGGLNEVNRRLNIFKSKRKTPSDRCGSI